MSTSYTSLLGFALPATGELSGTWGDTVNNSITTLLDSAIAGTTTIVLDQDVTLSNNDGTADTSRQAIILWTAGGSATRTITAPGQSKIYTVINASSGSQSIILNALATTGVTIAKGESALVAWNGSDFIKISNTAGPGTFTNLTVTGNTTLGDVVADTITVNSQFVTGTVLRSAQANANTLALAAYDVDGTAYTNLITLTASNTPTLALTSTGVGTINNMSIGATTASTGAFTTLSASSTVTLSGGTANGVAFLNGSNVLTTGSALVFDGSNLTVKGSAATKVVLSSSNNASDRGLSFTAADGTELGFFTQEYSTGLMTISSGTGSYTSEIALKTAGTERVRLTSTSLYTASTINVGIGNTNPDVKLYVQGSATALLSNQTSTYAPSANSGATSVKLFNDSSTTGAYTSLEFWARNAASNINIAYIASPSTSSDNTGTLTFGRRTGGSTSAESMRIDSSGNLGIGVTSPVSRIDARAASAIMGNYQTIQAFSTDTSAAIDLGGGISLGGFYNSTQFAQFGSIAGRKENGTSGNYNGYLQFGTNSQATGVREVMRLDSSGNLGLGVTPVASVYTPSRNLFVGQASNLIGRTTINFTSLNTNVYEAPTTSAATFINASTAAAQYQQYLGAHTWRVSTNTPTANTSIVWNDAMTLDASGNLLVGKTSFGGTATGGEIGANGVINSYSPDTTNASSTFAAYSNGASAYRFYVGWGGTIFATSIVITAISDERLKENVRDIDTGLSSIMALKPRRFDWKEGKGQDKKNVAGFIAQEFENVFPECVGASKAGGDGIEYKNINHETLIPTLVKAIQELKAEFDAYKASHP